jgi:hypothetical protein
MKFAVALTTTFVAVQSASIEAAAEDWPAYPYSYYHHSHYTEPEYPLEDGEVLPGADFNAHVYHFDEAEPIWDQGDYEERVKMEADMLVALEALKETVQYLHHDIDHLDAIVEYQHELIMHNEEDIFEN